MDLRLEIQQIRDGAFFPLPFRNYYGFRLQIAYSHAARLEFKTCVPQHAMPLSFNDFIRFWDEGAPHPADGLQSSVNPIFEGFVESITPSSETREVTIVCYDPTYRADKMIQVMSEPWAESPDFPIPSPIAIPRVVYNSTIDNDDDFALSLLFNATVGEILQVVLDDHQRPLFWLNASGPTPYVPTDLTSLKTQPQGKFVSQSETVRSVITRLLQQYQPAFKLIYTPQNRKWRFLDSTAGSAVTVTVNTDGDTEFHKCVIGMNMMRSIDGRYAAVKYYGPSDVVWMESIVHLPPPPPKAGETPPPPPPDPEEPEEPTLEVIIDGVVEINGMPSEIDCINGIRIIDPEFTRIARKGPYAINVPVSAMEWRDSNGILIETLATNLVQSWGPSIQVSYYDYNSLPGPYTAVSGWYCDFRSGEVTFGESCLYQVVRDPLEPSEEPEEPPVDPEDPPKNPAQVRLPASIKFVYPMLVEPISVRHPETGYEGTISTSAGINNEWRLYDEDLAVHRNFGVSVTTLTRLERFKDLAEQVHKKVKDVVVAGTLIFDGLDYQFAQLGRLVNVSGKDDNGGSITTGWESIAAPVTDVEYDFEANTTTIQINSDEMELVGLDPEGLKQALKIRAAEAIYEFSFSVAYYARGATFTETSRVTFRDQQGGIQ